MTTTEGDVIIIAPDQARRRLLAAARGLGRAWLTALGAAALLVLAAVAVVVVILMVSPVWALVWLVVVAGASYNVTRFWPRRPQRPGIELTADETARLRDWMVRGDHDDAFSRVCLGAGPGISLEDRQLVVGMPLLAVLGPDEMRGLVVHAIGATEIDRHLTVRRAKWIARGAIGRGPFGRTGRDAWLSRRLVERVADRSEEFWAALEEWLSAYRVSVERTDPLRARGLAARDLVGEGWDLVVNEWLGPALSRRCWHTTPYSGLRTFLDTADGAGWLDQPLPPGPPAMATIRALSNREQQVAERLLGDLRADLIRPITWEEHAAAVTVPGWLSWVAEVLDAARRARGEPVPATVNAVLSLLEEGWGPTVAEVTAADHGIDTGSEDSPAWVEWSAEFQHRTLVSLVAAAAVDATLVRPHWAWPTGVSLVATDGWTFPLESLVADVVDMVADGRGLSAAYAELSEALIGLGLDLDAPLWLDHGRLPGPERPVGAFMAVHRLGVRQVVVTDRVVHAFRRPLLRGLRETYGMELHGAEELRRRMVAVRQGDLTDETDAMPNAEVLRARFRPRMGGAGWRLQLNDGHRKLVLSGNGDGRFEEAVVASWLGERLTTTWVHAPRPLRLARNALGWLGMGLAGLGLVLAVVLGLHRPADLGAGVPWLIGLAALGMLVVGALPDLVLELVMRLRRPRLPAGLSSAAPAASEPEPAAS